jgi:hypothetical protein
MVINTAVRIIGVVIKMVVINVEVKMIGVVIKMVVKMMVKTMRVVSMVKTYMHHTSIA